MTNSIVKLNAKFNKLNKKYIALDKKQSKCNCEDLEISLSQQMEEVQIEMSKLSAQIEELEG